MEALPWTIFLSAVAMLITTVVGLTLGSFMAYREGSLFDVSLTIYSVVLTSIPYYVIAIVLLYVFGYQLAWFPTGGQMPPDAQVGLNVEFVVGVFYYATLPILSMIIPGLVALGMRGNAIRILGENYIRVARLRGLSERRIALRYVGRNAVLPMYTGLMIGLGGLFGGSIILETIFQYPGVGYYTFKALQARDYPLMMGGFLLITAATILGIFVADLTYGWIDPRASSGGEGHETY
jgi:peptide/nickel transport system permease protein